MLSVGTRRLLATVQAIVSYEWLVSGLDKIISGTFPQGLADALGEGLKDNPNGWYTSILNAVVVPNSVFFGYVIEFVELGIGLALLTGALLLFSPSLPARGKSGYRLARYEVAAAAVAAFLCVLLCVNFHFWMGDGMVSSVNPGNPFDEGIDLDTLLPPIGAIICILNARLLVAMIGDDVVRGRVAKLMARLPRRSHTLASA